MKTALITGGRGFVGRHLSLALHQGGVKVCGLGYGTWTESERAPWGMDHWLNGEVTKHNLDTIQSNIGKLGVVFHLAGGSSVGTSVSAPEEDFRRSVLSTFELLEWVRLVSPEVPLILASSAAVYGTIYNQAIREIDTLAPYSPYGYHKRITEELFESYSKNYGLKVAMVRLFSVYGPELRKQLLWDACCQLNKDSAHLVLGGSGDEFRDWLHITDAVQLLRMAAFQANHNSFLVNGGTGVAVKVREIAEKLCASWGMCPQLEFSGQSRQGDPQYLVANTDLAFSLGFIPQVRWQVGVADYVAWFKRIDRKGG